MVRDVRAAFELFQSTCLREARRGITTSSASRVRYFNPRAYVRHDCMRLEGVMVVCHFNPRAYVRHDLCDRSAVRRVAISIHVPT